MMQGPFFAISLMCMDFLDMRGQLEFFNRRADYYHVDIMDGHFAPNITLSPDIMAAVGKVATLPMDAHLMTTDPGRWIESVAKAGASIISPHAETINTNAFRMLRRIRDLGCRTGVVLNPATPLCSVECYLEHIDLLTIMTVDVGYAHQPFIEQMLRKIEQAAALRERQGLAFRIQVDGACNAATFGRLWNAGAEVFVMGGSGLFSLDEDIRAAYDRMLADFARAVTA